MTLDEKVGLLHQFSAAITRLGVPQFRTGTEGLHGLSWLGYATVFPQASGIGMTWNPDLTEQIGDVIGQEARAYNSVDARFNGVGVWGPVVDLARDPRYGRISETMGEDPYLIGQLGSSMGEGMQGNADGYLQSIPMLKHFAAYSQEASRTSYSANASPRNLQEYYFKSFKDPIEDGTVNGFMTGYNLINGKPSMVMPEVSDEMYGDWVQGGTEGAFFAVTDASSPSNLSGANAYYPNSRLGQAAAMADSIRNGIAAMTPSDTDTPTTRRWIYEAIARGMLTEADIDKSIYGVLLVRLHAGDLDPDPTNPYKALNKRNALDTAEHRSVALEAAREQVVLLKNQGGILPLSKSDDIALSGPLGDESSTDFYSGTFPYVTYISDKMRDKVTAGNGTFSFSRGIDTVALQVANGTGTPAGKFLTAGDSAGGALTGSGESSTDPKAQFQLYDYGYNNLLLRSVSTDRYLTASGSGNTVIANANPPGFQSPNRASQEWYTNQNLGIVARSGNIVSLRFSKGTSPVATNATPNVYVNTASPYNVQHNGSGSSTNRQFELITVKDGIADAVAAATSADVAVVAVGDQPHLTSRETYDRQSTGDGINLAPGQVALVNAVAAANPNTIVVIVGSYPFDVSAIKANPNVKGIVFTSHAGQELGSAVADVLFGDYAPSGRLTQTWYAGLSDLPTMSDFDVIKGKRTYQYHDGDVLYPFGYGLTYSDFEYADFSVAPNSVSNASIANATVNVKLTVKNTGTVKSDDVVQVYASYDDKANSRIEHPIRTLVGFDRLNLAGSSGGMVASDDLTIPVRLSDLAVWDVARGEFFLEPGTYTISAGHSSAAADQVASAKLTVTGNGLAARNLGTLTQAYNFDDYSYTDMTATGLQADVIPISVQDNDTYGISIRKAGAWVKYAQVDFTAHPGAIALRASNASTSTPAVVEVWANGSSVATGGVKLGDVTVPATSHAQTFVNVGADLSNVPSGVADLYLVSPASGVAISWLKLGATQVVAQSSDLAVTVNHYNSNIATSLTRFHVKVPAVVEQKSGSLALDTAIAAPAIVDGAVTWTVSDTNGDPTTLATVSAQGQLTATGTADGVVRVTATFPTSGGSVSASKDVTLRNQTVASGTNPEAVVIRSGYDSRPGDISWGPNQYGNFGSIYQYKGGVVLSAVTYPDPTTARPVTFTIADKDGNPTDLATLNVTGAGYIEGQTSGNNNRAYNATLTATGAGDGDVYVTATTTNGLSWTSKVVIQGQAERDLSAGRYQAELFDGKGNVGGVPSDIRAENVHGDDVGMQLNRVRNGDWAVYRNVNFGDGSDFEMTMRYLKVSSEVAKISVMAGDPVTGTKLGEVSLQGDLDITSAVDYRDPVYHWRDVTLPLHGASGVQDVYFVFEVSSAVPNTDISSTYGAVAGWLDLGINWFTVSPLAPGALSDAVNAAQALDSSVYTTSSWAAADVTGAIANAHAVIADPASVQSDLDEALAALNTALAQLVARGDSQTLAVLVAVGEAFGGKLGGFTDDSVAAFNDALENAASELAAGADRTQAQLDTAVTALQEAIDGLEVKAPTVNKAALNALYDTVRILKNPSNTYTTLSWKALQTEIQSAAGVIASSSATQEQVDAATASLSQAVADLTVLDKRPIKLKLSQTQLRLVKGKSLTVQDGLYYRDVLPASYSGKVTWKSSNTKVATVSSDGKITAKKTGTVTITVTSKETASTGKKLSASVKVYVVSKASKSKVTKVSATVPTTLSVGGVAYVTGTYSPSTATGVAVTYSSSSTSVATIDKAGRLLAKAHGTTTVSVKAGGKTTKHTVTVP
jgi:beta-glucosidase